MTKSTKKPVWSWRDAILASGAKPPTRHICLTISCYMSDAGKGWSISVKQLMLDTGLSNSSVATHLQYAIDCGLLRSKRIMNDIGHRVGTVYYPTFPSDCVLATEPPDMHVAHDAAEDDEIALDDPKSLSEPLSFRGGLSEPPVTLSEPPPRGGDTTLSEPPMTLSEGGSRQVPFLFLSNIYPVPPHPPAKRGARARLVEFEQMLASLQTPDRARVLDQLVAPIVRMRRFNAPDVAFALGQLCDWHKLRDLDDQALSEALEALKRERDTAVTMKAIENQVHALAQASDERKKRAKVIAANMLAVPAATLELWGRMVDFLRGLLGPAKTRAWFEQMHVFGFEGGTLTLGVELRMQQGYVLANFQHHIEQAGRVCGAEIRRIHVVVIGDAANSRRIA